MAIVPRALELVKGIALSASWPQPTTIDGTTDLKTLKLLQALNFTGLMLARRYRWRFLQKTGTVRTMAKYETGDADVTLGSRTVTSDNALTQWTTEMVGGKFKIDSYEEVYEIVHVDPPNTLTLAEKWNDDTATDQSYKIARDRYLLPKDFTHESHFFQFLTPRHLKLLSPVEFDARRYGPGMIYPWGGTSELFTDDPDAATIRGLGDDDRYVLELDPIPGSVMQVVFRYYAKVQKLERDDDRWPFEDYLEPVLHDGALHYIRLNAQDDTRAQASMQEFFSNREELSGIEPFDPQPRFKAYTGRERLSKRLRRRSKGDTDWGTAFDRGLV